MKKMIAIALVLMLCVSALSVVAFAADNVTVYAKVPEGWTSVGAYTWEPEDFGSWPGSQMTLNADGWYEITMPGTHTTLIINADGGKQTVDLTIEAGKDVWVTVSDEQEGGKNKATISYDGGNTGSATPGNPEPPVVTPTFDAYYVAGTGALCNGKEWDPGAAENKMTKGDDGLWTITYTNVPAGEYEVKVTAGSWDNNWGANGAANGDNVKFSISEAGDITVKFNPATGYINVYNGNNPLTGDSTLNLAGLSIALLAATAGVVALTGKKKEF